MSYTQFRLTSGEELIAEVLQEPEGEDYNIVVRKAMVIIRAEAGDGTRMYTFRPWMTYQMSDSYMQLLNYNHIVGEAKPDHHLLEQFQKAYNLEIEDEARNPHDLEELRSMAKQLSSNLRLVDDEDDSDSPMSNVIELFNKQRKDKLH